MTKTAINRLVCALLLSACCWCGPVATAQQEKPVAAKTASKASSVVRCTKKGMACCKGTPTRAAVLAANLPKAKPVKN